MIITAKMNREFGVCYSDERLAALYGAGKTPAEVATLKTGPWANVSDKDRCWILWRVIATENRPAMFEALSRMLERVLPKNCDPRSRAVVTTLRENKVTQEVKDAAYAAAYAATYAAATAAYAAAYADAAYVAYVAAYGASYGAPCGAAERRAQLLDIVELLI